ARLDEQRLREECVRRRLGHDADADAVQGIGTRERIDDVQLLAQLEVRDDLVAQPEELLLLERTIDVAPPDSILGAALAHDELVVWRAPGVRAGVDDERPAFGEHSLPPLERPRVERGGRRISMDGSGRLEAVLHEVDAAAAFGRRHRRIVLATALPREELR